MENRRFLLICILGVLLFFTWQAWKADQAELAEQRPAPVQPIPEIADDLPGAPDPVAEEGDLPDLPAARAVEETAPAGEPTHDVSAPSTGEAAAETIVVETDVIRARINLAGGDIRGLLLLHYPESERRPDPLPLLDDSEAKWSVVQSGVLAPQGHPATQHSQYTALSRNHTLGEGDDRVRVVLETRSDTGVVVTKTYTFYRGEYRFDLDHAVRNEGSDAIDASAFVQLWRRDHTLGDQPPFAPTFTGYGFYEARNGGDRYRFQKISFSDVHDDPVTIEQVGGWLAVMQHYFAVAALPPQDGLLRFSARPASRLGYLGQVTGEPVRIAPGDEAVLPMQVFAGPKLQTRLRDVAPGFQLTIDYGILTPLSAPLFWVLNQIHRLLGNWGWSIVVLTLLVKVAMYKLSEAQFRSFAKMRHFAPRIQELRERYGDDRQRLNQAMMDLYKKEGFNPLGGCLPMLVQFPVFIALYWVLLESVELRQAPFIGWITNLSVPDPFYVLPVLFAASMWLQQKLSGQMAAMEPMQQRIMMAMPIVLGAFFTLFPAGLVLYWLVSNLVSIGQQHYINRKIDREGIGKRPAKKNGKKK